MPDHVREDGAGPRPGADHAALVRPVQMHRLFSELRVDERSLFEIFATVPSARRQLPAVSFVVDDPPKIVLMADQS